MAMDAHRRGGSIKKLGVIYLDGGSIKELAGRSGSTGQFFFETPYCTVTNLKKKLKPNACKENREARFGHLAAWPGARFPFTGSSKFWKVSEIRSSRNVPKTAPAERPKCPKTL